MSPTVNVSDLATAWLNANYDQKLALAETLKQQFRLEDVSSLKRTFIKSDFFYLDHRLDLVVHEVDKDWFIENVMMKQTSKQKHSDITDFILDLFMSASHHIEKPRDILGRSLLKLIMQMHQDQVI